MRISPPPSIPIQPSATPLTNDKKAVDEQPPQQEEKTHGSHGPKGHHPGMARQNSHLQKQFMSKLAPNNTKNEPQQTAIELDPDGEGAKHSATDDAAELHRAIKRQDFASFEALLRNGANPEAVDQDGKTPLELALDIFESMCRQKREASAIALAHSFVVTLVAARVTVKAANMMRVSWAQRWKA